MRKTCTCYGEITTVLQAWLWGKYWFNIYSRNAHKSSYLLRLKIFVHGMLNYNHHNCIPLNVTVWCCPTHFWGWLFYEHNVWHCAWDDTMLGPYVMPYPLVVGFVRDLTLAYRDHPLVLVLKQTSIIIWCVHHGDLGWPTWEKVIHMSLSCEQKISQHTRQVVEEKVTKTLCSNHHLLILLNYKIFIPVGCVHIFRTKMYMYDDTIVGIISWNTSTPWRVCHGYSL